MNFFFSICNDLRRPDIILTELDRKSTLNIDFSNVKKFINFNNIKYVFVREAIEVINQDEFASNDIVHAKLNNRLCDIINE